MYFLPFSRDPYKIEQICDNFLIFFKFNISRLWFNIPQKKKDYDLIYRLEKRKTDMKWEYSKPRIVAPGFRNFDRKYVLQLADDYNLRILQVGDR